MVASIIVLILNKMHNNHRQIEIYAYSTEIMRFLHEHEDKSNRKPIRFSYHGKSQL